MRALVYTAPRHVELQDLPRLRPAAGECEIAVSAAGICGLDRAAFLGRSRIAVPPVVLGHELIGRLSNGRRVVVNPLIACGRCASCRAGAPNLCSDWRLLGVNPTPGCFAEFVTFPRAQVHEIPGDLADKRAILAEPLANIVHLLRLAAPQPGLRIGIVGAGLMGSLALLAGLRLGVREALVAEPDGARRAAALQMGAALAFDPAASASREEAVSFTSSGLELVIDACGSGDARRLAFHLSRPGGMVALLGMAQPRSALDFGAAIRKEQRVLMSFGYTPADFERSLELLIAGAIDLDPWIDELPLEDGRKAFEQVCGAPGGPLKMMLRVA